ncbi:MAG TPA: GTP pyrophosphokinase family protein [Myxococcota bacterium]|nr:GTP pyrophosphokinase family protein [Myxococcota bacterium]
MSHRLLDDFERERALLPRTCQTLEATLEAALSAHRPALKVHSVRARTKTLDSLAGKLARPDKTYRDLWDVTDLVGLRVIVYFEDDVPIVGQLIERAFDVDYQHSIDKRSGDIRFGYRSVHYVCRLPGFPDQRPAPRFEIQVRTVLEHAWAEIEHDLGYKSRDAMPAPARRRLHRLAGLLELADQEFSAIRHDLSDYAARLPARLEAAEDLPLDLLSLDRVLVLPECEHVDRSIADLLHRPLAQAPFYPDYLLRMLRCVGLEHSGDVRHHLATHAPKLVSLARPYFTFARQTWNLEPDALRGYALFFLAHWHALTSTHTSLDKVTRLATLYRELDHPHDEREAHRVASQLFEAFRQSGVLPG